MNNIRQTISKQLYQYGGQQLEYTLVKSSRRKTSEIIVDENEITLRIPFTKSLIDAEKLMDSKIRWIIRKQNEYREQIREIIKPNFLQGSTLPYLGKNYEIRIINERNSANDKIELGNDEFVIALSFKKNSLDCDDSRIKLLYEDWLYHQAKSIFEQKIKRFGNIIDVSPKKFVVKNLKNRWGSLSRNNTINLNLNLIKAPHDVIDYVIIHELCHIRIKKHSHHFWDLLQKYVPNYKANIQWLETNGKYLLV